MPELVRIENRIRRLNTLSRARRDTRMSFLGRELAGLLYDRSWTLFTDAELEEYEYAFSELEGYGYLRRHKARPDTWVVVAS